MKSLPGNKLAVWSTVVAGIGILLLLSAIMWWSLHSTTIKKPTVTVGGHQFNVVIATTAAQQHRGLGGTKQLGANQGMYFPLNGQLDAAFWMKDMFIPIDIIWIQHQRIVGIDANVPAPAPGTPDAQLPLYFSPVTKTDAVLEVAAGRTADLHITPGDTIDLNFK